MPWEETCDFPPNLRDSKTPSGESRAMGLLSLSGVLEVGRGGGALRAE